jgi:hypothetical protein
VKTPKCSVILFGLWACAACGDSGSEAQDSGGATNTGGNRAGSSGGSSGSGGVLATGGYSASAGGADVTGGAQGGGAAQASGGTPSAGGSSATGGFARGGSDGRGGRSGGGSTGVGGTVVSTGGSGGSPAAGGTPDSGGAPGTGGIHTGGAATGGWGNCTVPTPPSAKDSVTVDMGTAQGAPTYRASGFIYGISQDGSQPQNTLLSDIKVTHLRCGGAQIGCPNGGYVNGQYAARWNAVKAYYTKAKAIGAKLLILVHDVWGADAVCKVPRWPGDGGNWTDYTSFMTQLLDDAKTAGMTAADVRWELWNEPDYGAFWGATQSQWLEMWKRGYQQVRAAFPDAVIEGPSLASGVGGWFNAFLDYAKTNDVVPDVLGWHEAGGGDPVNDTRAARSALSSRGIDVTNLDISEYGSSSDQTPGHSAWYIARLESAGVDGLRSNWGGGNGLYSTMGALVTGSWQATSQWWIYKRYADQTGLRSSTTAGSQVDAVAYQDEAKTQSIIVVGNRGGTTGNVNVVIKNMPGWLVNDGSTKVVLEKMPSGNSAVSAPTVVSSSAAPVTCGALTVTIDWSTPTDGYVVTLTPS